MSDLQSRYNALRGLYLEHIHEHRLGGSIRPDECTSCVNIMENQIADALIHRESVWEVADQEHAFDQGWGIFAIDGDANFQVIQRLDETGRFDNDDEAVAYVWGRADAGDALARKAIRLFNTQE